jgi:hypothetical protein
MRDRVRDVIQEMKTTPSNKNPSMVSMFSYRTLIIPNKSNNEEEWKRVC